MLTSVRTRNSKGVYKRVPLEVRFWEKVDVRGEDQCWYWLGAVRNGYGYITDYWQKIYAHRYSYELRYGPIPDGRWIQVTHSCDVALCVNPKHLWAGTVKTNSDDRINRDRVPRGESHYRAKVTEDDVRYIRRRYAEGGVTQAFLGQAFGIPQTTVSHIIHRNTWKHVKD